MKPPQAFTRSGQPIAAYIDLVERPEDGVELVRPVPPRERGRRPMPSVEAAEA